MDTQLLMLIRDLQMANMATRATTTGRGRAATAGAQGIPAAPGIDFSTMLAAGGMPAAMLPSLQPSLQPNPAAVLPSLVPGATAPILGAGATAPILGAGATAPILGAGAGGVNPAVVTALARLGLQRLQQLISEGLPTQPPAAATHNDGDDGSKAEAAAAAKVGDGVPVPEPEAAAEAAALQLENMMPTLLSLLPPLGQPLSPPPTDSGLDNVAAPHSAPGGRPLATGSDSERPELPNPSLGDLAAGTAIRNLQDLNLGNRGSGSVNVSASGAVQGPPEPQPPPQARAEGLSASGSNGHIRPGSAPQDENLQPADNNSGGTSAGGATLGAEAPEPRGQT
ncbi:hypothetical protein VOLCADRAFT_100591 [Volvox carteri f. nagariensis]|uniref:Uncharacterized protein n=1 Tax=Volvox carteri f. nagariensis TaxID=3068 RepID=D8UKK3_VOLCA|nr:uncharacterized protein VOLCADRAFT_100591 [Volvox carteri f. nagariensis]EFJ39754.1 hypothetical protein VOLCADRAFT_100591 [Volvox carteri f. nagariensis]|eukprot:XP_002959192.1 hypothetical protein VOLCADRAFT_100591 [Volvox carteri f. nagariensis]